MSAGSPRSLSSLGSESWGGFWSVLFSDVWLWRSSSTSALRSSSMAFSDRGVGAVESRGASVSILSSLSSSTTTSESHCWGPSSAMETSLTSQPSNHGEDRHGWESPPVEEHLSHSSSSSCTWSSQVMGGDQATSIASLKAICWVSAFLDVSLCGGWGGVGNFWPQELDESRGDPPHGVWDRAHFLLQLHHSLTFCWCCDLLCNPLGLGASGLSSHSQVLLLGPWEGLQWSPEASMHPCSSSHQCHLISY